MCPLNKRKLYVKLARNWYSINTKEIQGRKACKEHCPKSEGMDSHIKISALNSVETICNSFKHIDTVSERNI